MTRQVMINGRRGSGRRRVRQVSRSARWLIIVVGVLLVVGVTAAAIVRRPTTPAAWNPPTSGAPSTGATTGSSPTSAPVTAPTTTAASPPHYVFPVAGKNSYAHTHHDYPASDIIAACGLPVRAVTDGVILEVSRVDKWTKATNDGAERGGLFVSLLGDDGVRYYGSHLRSVANGIDAGVRVRAGDTLGVVGDTGDASVCHLHFGISPPCQAVGDWWVRRGVIWPWSYLDSWKAGGNKSAVTEVADWQRVHGCPTAP
jgi:peptidoglycan LD-endopeptidase LytH